MSETIAQSNEIYKLAYVQDTLNQANMGVVEVCKQLLATSQSKSNMPKTKKYIYKPQQQPRPFLLRWKNGKMVLHPCGEVGGSSTSCNKNMEVVDTQRSILSDLTEPEPSSNLLLSGFPRKKSWPFPPTMKSEHDSLIDSDSDSAPKIGGGTNSRKRKAATIAVEMTVSTGLSSTSPTTIHFQAQLLQVTNNEEITIGVPYTDCLNSKWHHHSVKSNTEFAKLQLCFIYGKDGASKLFDYPSENLPSFYDLTPSNPRVTKFTVQDHDKNDIVFGSGTKGPNSNNKRMHDIMDEVAVLYWALNGKHPNIVNNDVHKEIKTRYLLLYLACIAQYPPKRNGEELTSISNAEHHPRARFFKHIKPSKVKAKNETFAPYYIQIHIGDAMMQFKDWLMNRTKPREYGEQNKKKKKFEKPRYKIYPPKYTYP